MVEGVRGVAPRRGAWAAVAVVGEEDKALQAAHDRGARVLSVWSGAIVLGEAGLLDDRECTTHWRYTDELESRFPRAGRP